MNSLKILLPLMGIASAAAGQSRPESRLEQELSRIAETAQGVVGVAAIHPETGRSAFLNRTERFPMASTYKIPIAVRLLSLVDRGQLRLDSLVPLTPNDIYLSTAGVISHRLLPGSALTVRNLLELMLTLSDNNATDILLRMAGGGKAVTAELHRLGIDGVRVDRPTWAAIANWKGRTDISEDHPLPRDGLSRFDWTDSPEQIQAFDAAFDRDGRDAATPEGMAALLGKIWRREALSAASTDLLLGIMSRCETSPGRMKGYLPQNTPVAHKTGTIGSSTNDVGFIDLPQGRGHLILVLFLKRSTLPDPAARDNILAQLSRTAYDYFTLTP